MAPIMNYAEASSFLGWVSLGCWIIVYSPQLIENYRLKSGEGLSVAFVLIWLAGDLSNLIGAVLARLLPTVIILPVYIYYYRYTHPVHVASPEFANQDPSEASSLLPKPTAHPENRDHGGRILLHMLPYALGTVFVLAIGTVAHLVNEGDIQMNMEQGPPKHVFEWRSQIAGWLSAFLYLISRVPQIFKNLKTKCAGLSPLLFTFAMAGNATYIASILVMSTEPRYLAVNASWLAGSIVTIFLDLIVLAQFIYFRSFGNASVLVEDAAHPWSEAQ